MATTGGALDAGIQGNGFFVVTDSNNNQLYTRDGSFQLDANGNLLTRPARTCRAGPPPTA